MTCRTLFWAAALAGLPWAPACVFAQAAPAAAAAPREAEEIDFANGLLSRGMYDMAASEFQKFISQYPRSRYCEEAYLDIGESWFLLQDFPKAVEAFKHFRQLYPNSPDLPQAALRLAQIDLQQKKYDDALHELGAVEIEKKLKGQIAQSFYFYTGKAFKARGDLAAAMTNFQKAAAAPDAGEYTAHAYQAIAEIDTQNAQYPAAAEAYRKAIAAAPEGDLKGYLIYRLGEANFGAGDYAQAVAQFQQVLDQYASLPVTKDALTNLLLARFNAGQYDYLLAVYKNNLNLTKADASYFDIHFAAAKAHVQLKQYGDALALLDQILALPGLSEEQKQKATVAKAGVLVKQNRYKESIALVEAAGSKAPAAAGDEKDFVQAQAYYGMGDFGRSSGAFADIVNNHPDSGFARAAILGMAHAKQEAGDYAEASRLFLKYYDGEEDQNSKSEALYAAALMEAKAKADGHAITLAQKYLKTFPKGAYYEQSVLLLANLYGLVRQPQQAVDLLQEYLRHPEAVQKLNDVYFLLGYNQQLLGQSDAALETYAKVSAGKDPQVYVSALKNSAAIHLNQHKDGEAAAVYDRLITELDQNHLDPKTYIWVCDEYLKEKKYKGVLRIAGKAEGYFPNQERQQLEYFKAEASRALEDYAAAEKSYGEALSSPDKNTYSGAAHIGLGLVYEQTARFDQAKAEFQKAVEDNGDDHTVTLRARFELGNIAAQQKNPEEALKFYLLVSTIYEDPQYCPESLLRAGAILEQLNRGPEALKAYAEIMEKYKDSPQAGPAKERTAVLSAPPK